jgi:hypothetical protein
MNALRVGHYIGRADDFYRGLELIRGEQDYRCSSALLAIHSAISYSDALRVGLGETQVHADDHRGALASLKRLLGSRRIKDEGGFAQFEYLISMKTFVAYGNQRLDEKRWMRINLSAERFANWVWRVAKELNMEGWSDGAE